TKTKLFCGCSTAFGLSPNSATCPVCAGHPGVLPVMNRRAFELALRAALALNCQVATFTKWDRKNYFYPDLPKNYQISQYDLPFSKDGWLEIETAAGSMRVDANVNLHVPQPDGTVAATPIVEVKNLNSIRAVARAMEHEAQRQYDKFLADCKKLGEESKETRGWDEARAATFSQRRKE